MRHAVVVVAALALTGAGCATSLSSFRPAHVAPRGSWQAEVGFDVSVPTGTISRSIDAGEALLTAARARMLTPEERARVVEAGVNVALNPPAAVEHVTVAYTPLDRWDVGLRYSAGAWRLGSRYQFLAQETHGYDLSVGLGAERFTFEFPVQEVIEAIEVNDYVRWNVDVPITFGRHADWYRWWGGPRLLLSTFDAAMSVQLPNEQAFGASASGRAVYVGGQAGLAFGWRNVFLGAELTIVRLFSTAHLDTPGRTDEADLDGFVVYPGIALMGEF